MVQERILITETMPTSLSRQQGRRQANDGHQPTIITTRSNCSGPTDTTSMAASTRVRLLKNDRYKKSSFVNRSVPILFIIVCFLVIANSKCDQVGSTNESVAETAAAITVGNSKGLVIETSQPNRAKYDPLSMLREIYLDHDSHIITMISPQISDSVQKFHPNGRYGRRSVNNFAEPSVAHVELGKLRFADGAGPLRSILHSVSHDSSAHNKDNNNKDSANNNNNKDNNNSNKLVAGHQYQYANQELPVQSIGDNSEYVLGDSGNYESELNKLLKCNYAGFSNLYWCESGN